MERPTLIRPGEFGIEAAADRRRGIFDYHNEAILARRTAVDAVFIGDSITDMWALDVFFRGSRGVIVNRGISGDRTPFVRRRFEADVLQLRPRLAVILIGVNNSWDLDIWWDASLVRSPQEIEDEIVRDTTEMVGRAAQGMTVALCSILPTDVPFNGNTAVRNALIARANARLAGLARERGAIYVDYHARLVADDGLTLRAGFADDGLHPHVRGYEVMAAALLETLAAHQVDVISAT